MAQGGDDVGLGGVDAEGDPGRVTGQQDHEPEDQQPSSPPRLTRRIAVRSARRNSMRSPNHVAAGRVSATPPDVRYPSTSRGS
jgi:hypothetical protein